MKLIVSDKPSEADLGPEELLTTRQAASLLGLNALSTVRQYLKLGYLQGSRLLDGNGAWRVYRSSVDALLKRRPNAAASPLPTAEDFEGIIDALVEGVA